MNKFILAAGLATAFVLALQSGSVGRETGKWTVAPATIGASAGAVLDRLGAPRQ